MSNAQAQSHSQCLYTCATTFKPHSIEQERCEDSCWKLARHAYLEANTVTYEQANHDIKQSKQAEQCFDKCIEDNNDVTRWRKQTKCIKKCGFRQETIIEPVGYPFLKKHNDILQSIYNETKNLTPTRYLSDETLSEMSILDDKVNLINSIFTKKGKVEDIKSELARIFGGEYAPVDLADKSDNESLIYTINLKSDTCYLIFDIFDDHLLTNKEEEEYNINFYYHSTRDSIQKFSIPANNTIIGFCSTQNYKLSRHCNNNYDIIPAIISFPRNQFPLWLSMKTEIDFPQFKDRGECKKLNESEGEWIYTPKYKSFPVMRRSYTPSQAPSNGTIAKVDCSAPYAYYDYFRTPVPGTLYYKDNQPVLIYERNSDSAYTVINITGQVYITDITNLLQRPVAPTLLNRNLDMLPTRAKCQCKTLDTDKGVLPKTAAECVKNKDAFGCCEKAMRSHFNAQIVKLKKELQNANTPEKQQELQNNLEQAQSTLEQNREIYQNCGLDYTRAYEVQELILTGKDEAYNLPAAFTPQVLDNTYMPADMISIYDYNRTKAISTSQETDQQNPNTTEETINPDNPIKSKYPKEAIKISIFEVYCQLTSNHGKTPDDYAYNWQRCYSNANSYIQNYPICIGTLNNYLGCQINNTCSNQLATYQSCMHENYNTEAKTSFEDSGFNSSPFKNSGGCAGFKLF